jgi:hypothetical protein
MHRAIELDTKHGISNRFLAFIRGVDASAGKTVLGEGQTISGKATEIASQATAQAKEVDEKKGITKSLSDVSPVSTSAIELTPAISTTQRPSTLLSDRKFLLFTPRRPNKSLISTRKLSASRRQRAAPASALTLPPRLPPPPPRLLQLNLDYKHHPVSEFRWTL